MSMEFESNLVRSTSYLDPMDSTPFSLLDNGMDYLYDQPAHSPLLGSSLGLAGSSASPSIDFHNLSLPTHTFSESYTYGSSMFGHPSPPRSFSPIAEGASISPPQLSYPLSGSQDGSSDESHAPATPAPRKRSEMSPPPAVPYAATVPRAARRYNPIAIPATRSSARNAHKRKDSRSSLDRISDDEDDEHDHDNDHDQISNVDSADRREIIRQQRINSEQRRRDDLREGYARLKAVLPPSTAKSSKVNLLDRAAHHLKHLEACKLEAEKQLKAVQSELVRVRQINEVLSLRTVQTQRDMLASANGPSPQF